MALKSIFLSMVLLLAYSYKREREIDTDIAIIIVIAVSVASVFLYFINIKKYVLTQKVKQLYNVDIKSKEMESARALIHRGRFDPALTKFKSVMSKNPDNEDIKKIITLLEHHLSH